MRTRETLKAAEARLLAVGVPDARLDAEYLLAEALQTPRLSLLLDRDREIAPGEAAAFEDMLLRREKREPLQYILGTQPFMGLLLHTDERALIPRNDTETLCEKALERIPPRGRVLDLCTGSGALAIAMGKIRPDALVTACDLSESALSLARENAARLDVRVRFLQGDLFQPAAGETFHVIVSNPPYIPDGMRGKLQEEVEREPGMALFAGPDGLDFYRRIALEAPAHLEKDGWLLMEIGDGQADAVRELLRDRFEKIGLFNDLNGLPRVVQGQKKG